MPKPPSVRPFDSHADTRVRTAMEDTRIVALVGPRQSGKTTLARQIAADRGLTFVTLDDDQSRQFAIEDPDGFVRDLDRAVIDEIQRAPWLILALKKSVDEDLRPGRFLITGSVDLFRSSLSPDSLADASRPCSFCRSARPRSSGAARRGSSSGPSAPIFPN